MRFKEKQEKDLQKIIIKEDTPINKEIILEKGDIIYVDKSQFKEKVSSSIIKKIKYEVGDWELEPFTNASFDEVVEDVIYNMENYGENLKTALQHTNDKIMDGQL